MYWGTIAIACLTVVLGCDGARILGLAPFSMRSHWIVMEPLFQKLAAVGHNVTVFSSFPQKTPLPNYKDIDFSHRMKPIVDTFTFDMIKTTLPSPWVATFFFNSSHGSSCKLLDEPEYKDLLRAKDNYDIIITEVFGNDCFRLLCVQAWNSDDFDYDRYHALLQSRPFPPNVVEIGGIHIKEKQPLAKDLQELLDNAKKGAIVMSFGSLVRTCTLPKHVIRMFMNVFSRIPQIVILKYEEDFPEAPKNVIMRKWLSQRDLIEHENVVAVIAHGGLSSTIEVVNFGKPMIGIPFFTDQFRNVKLVEEKGACIYLDIK
ncbi:UDP-glucosyltransferase 2-like [Homalodisca vitripennis]|uniref:UDP-glucosyltransferase 2-like n=1 Tax=Homalodisca vitripennis TaxID=197043 RepID=UPI001EEAD535|nr:UDP-glucosyltransferase 2-like [Homalodisca vitripennis]